MAEDGPVYPAVNEAHQSVWDRGDDDWINVSCICGGFELSAPDAETAGDSWGDHMFDVGFARAIAGKRET